MQRVTRVAVPAAAALVGVMLLAVVNRQTVFVETWIGGTIQWVLTVTVIVGLAVSGAALGVVWASVCRFRSAAIAAPVATSIGVASVFLFAQTYSPAGSSAAGFIGLTAIGAMLVAVVSAGVALIGSIPRSGTIAGTRVRRGRVETPSFSVPWPEGTDRQQPGEVGSGTRSGCSGSSGVRRC